MLKSDAIRSGDIAKRAIGAIPVALATLELRPDTEKPLYRQLYEAIQQAIVTGALPPGALLPPTRVMANAMGTARATVVTAFDQLTAEGYLVARVGHGTRVAQIAPDLFLKPHNPGAAPRVNRRAAKLLDMLKGVGSERADRPEPVLPFMPGVPDLVRFPHRAWARVLGAAARGARPHDLDYSEQTGHWGLREAIRRHVHEARGIVCGADQIIITNGAKSAFALAADMLLEPGDIAYIEDPGCQYAAWAFSGVGARLIPVPVDEEGANLERAFGPSPQVIYTTPSHQFPLGPTMSLERRLMLLRLAERAGAYIIEDDYDSEYRYEGRPTASLFGLDQTGAVLYVGTFSKTMFPGVRTGYLIVPKALLPAANASATRWGLGPPRTIQAALASFLTQGYFSTHIRRMRTSYAKRHELMMQARWSLPAWATLKPAHTGSQMPLLFPRGTDDLVLTQFVRDRGMRAFPLSKTSLSRGTISDFLLGFSHVEEADIPLAMKRLGEILAASAPRGTPPQLS